MKTSVLVITYNHEMYISKALQNILMQRTKFQIELVIGEDCSTDNTRAICEDYAQKHPNIIRLLPSEKNLGMMPNFTRTLQACTGKYIALCEGDDYWTDPYKLQKQVDFLEGNEEYSACMHDVEIRHEVHFDRIPFFIYKDMEFIKEVMHYFYPTCSKLFRRKCLGEKEYDLLKLDTGGGDKTLLFIFFKHGKIKFLNEKMGVYRIHSGGISLNTGFQKRYKSSICLYKALIPYFNNKEYNKAFKKALLVNYGKLALTAHEKKKHWKSFFLVFKSMKYIQSFYDIKIIIKDFVFHLLYFRNKPL